MSDQTGSDRAGLCKLSAEEYINHKIHLHAQNIKMEKTVKTRAWRRESVTPTLFFETVLAYSEATKEASPEAECTTEGYPGPSNPLPVQPEVHMHVRSIESIYFFRIVCRSISATGKLYLSDMENMKNTVPSKTSQMKESYRLKM